MFAPYTIKYVGRKKLLIWGHIGIAVIHASVAIFNIEGNRIGVVTMVTIFLFVYYNTSGPIAWMYAAETTIDAGMGICFMMLWGTTVILTLVCPIIMDPKCLGPNTTFFILTGCGAI